MQNKFFHIYKKISMVKLIEFNSEFCKNAICDKHSQKKRKTKKEQVFARICDICER
jgi:hypothetical protein